MGSVSEVLTAAADAATAGAAATIPLQARKGRASYLGERSIGHQDPGRDQHRVPAAGPRGRSQGLNPIGARRWLSSRDPQVKGSDT